MKFSEKINFENFFIFDLKTIPNLILLDRFLPLNTKHNPKNLVRYLLIISCCEIKVKKNSKMTVPLTFTLPFRPYLFDHDFG